MTVGSGRGGGGGTAERAGTRTLRLLAEPIKTDILRLLLERQEGPLEPSEDLDPELEQEEEEQEELDPDEPGLVITPAGKEMYYVGTLLERWLARAPGGDLPYGGDGATEAIEALAESWALTVLHALAAAPRTLAELDRLLDARDRATIERCLDSMRLTGQLELRSGEGAATYAATEWLREGLAPLAAAARLERRNATGGSAPIDALDVEGALQLALPLVRAPAGLSGSCRLAVELGAGRVAGVTAHLREGRLASCEPSLTEPPDAAATGNVRDWFRATIDGSAKRLDFGGERRLARGLIEALHEALYGDGEEAGARAG